MKISQKETLEQIISQFTEQELKIFETNRFGYIFAKAWLYIEIGPEKYRKIDFYQQPPSDFDTVDLAIITHGCNQVIDGIGMTKEKPFTGLDVSGFNALFKLFHFESIERKTEFKFTLNDKKGILDCITFQHLIDGSQVVYYNFC